MNSTEEVPDSYPRHLFDSNTAFNVYKNDITNLSVGAPGVDLLKHCTRMINAATSHRLAEEDKEGKYYLFQYGVSQGLWEYREELSKFLSRRYGDPVKREELVLTCGATHGLQLFLSILQSPNGVIFVEEVTYMIALDVFKQHPLIHVVTVPMKDDVVDLDAMEEIVMEQKKKMKENCIITEEKIFWAMFYTIPTFHNPTGMTLSPESCKRLVQIARKNSMAIFCDDVYNLLYYGDKHPPHRLLFYDEPTDPDYTGGNIISNGSFSKILSPAMRIGWIESSPRIVDIMTNSGVMTSGGSVNSYMSGVIASLLQLGIQDEHLDKTNTLYKDKLIALCETLDRYLPTCCSYKQPEGGYFVWIHLPEGVDSAEFLSWCEQDYKVSALPSARFSYEAEKKNCLRISISFHEKERLVEAAKNLCTALLKYIRNSVQ